MNTCYLTSILTPRLTRPNLMSKIWFCRQPLRFMSWWVSGMTGKTLRMMAQMFHLKFFSFSSILQNPWAQNLYMAHVSQIEHSFVPKIRWAMIFNCLLIFIFCRIKNYMILLFSVFLILIVYFGRTDKVTNLGPVYALILIKSTSGSKQTCILMLIHIYKQFNWPISCSPQISHHDSLYPSTIVMKYTIK